MVRRRRHRISIAAFLKDKDMEVRQAAADLMNAASDKIVRQIRSNLHAQGIVNRTGKLYSSIEIKKETAKSPRVVIMSEVYAPLPKNEQKMRDIYNSMTKHERLFRRKVRKPMRFTYPAEGVPYGRIIEFSPRINKPWFYKAWYDTRFEVEESIINGVLKAWSGK